LDLQLVHTRGRLLAGFHGGFRSYTFPTIDARESRGMVDSERLVSVPAVTPSDSWRVSAFFEDSTICVSNAIRDILVGDYRFPAKKTITIYNGVSLSEFDHYEDKALI